MKSPRQADPGARGSRRWGYAIIGDAVALVCLLAWWHRTLSRPPDEHGPKISLAGSGPAATGLSVQASAAMATTTPAPRPSGSPRASQAAETESATRPTLNRLTDPSEPIEHRLAAVEALGQRGDEPSARSLMAVADHDPALRAAAITALTHMPPSTVDAFLRARLVDPDPRVLAAAIRSLGQTAGAAAVGAIGQTLQQNHRRDDGYEDTVCGACVETLGAIGAATAVPLLTAELEQTVGKELQHEYGSQVVAALGRIRDATARPALQSYADRLRAEREQQHGNPLGQRYLDQKIAEVTTALDSLK
jgi:hypothetical protein